MPYKTNLTPQEEQQFLKWYKMVAMMNQLDSDPDHPYHHYDYRGFWKNSSEQDRLTMSLYNFNKHFPDTYKTPMHPTFSDESIYSNAFTPGGHWDGETFVDSEWTKSRSYMPKLSDIEAFIKSYEDFKPHVYTVNGQKLIGYGFADASLIAKGSITRKEADKILSEKIKFIESELSKKVPNWNMLNRGTQLAMIDVAYNGNGPKTIYVQSPNLMKLLESGNFTSQQIANELDHSKNSGGWLGVRSAARRAMVTGYYYWNSPNKDSLGRHVNPDVKSNVDSETSPYLSFKNGGNIRKFQPGGSTRQVFQLNTIPTKNKVVVIDNFSPNYNYIVEGDKVYYARKGRDYWVDISDNDVARQNLLKHLSQYDFKGYDDNERSLWAEDPKRKEQSPTSGVPPFTIPTDTTPVTPVTPTSNEAPMMGRYNWQFGDNDMYLTDQWGNKFPMPTYPKTVSTNTSVSKLESNNNSSNSTWRTTSGSVSPSYTMEWNKASHLAQLGKNTVRRIADKRSSEDETVMIVEPPELDSEYAIRPGVQVSDTLTRSKSDFADRYFLSEYIPGDAYTYAGRNRGDFTPRFNTEGAPITLIFPLLPYDKNKVDPLTTYIGYDKNGNLKAGTGADFSEGDTMSKTWRNNISHFEVDSNGNVKGVHRNKNRSYLHPITWFYSETDGTLQSDEHRPEKAMVNIMYNDPSHYGSVEGGRVLIQTGPEIAIVSGSMNTIHQKFEEMKARNGVDRGWFYTLDNGSFAMGLRTKSKQFTERDLRLYDAENRNKNNTGAHMMYITGTPAPKFSSDTTWTPNIRTTESDSYKKGHSLENERRGVVLHHTAFMDPDLTGVTNRFMNPKSEASSHVIIGYDGHRRVFAEPNQVTFHAGASYWNGQSNVNDFMIGIEFQGDTTQKPLTEEQIQSAVEYLKPIIRENNIRLEDVVTHEQVRTLYNQYRQQYNLGRKAESKCDITLSDYERIINALKEQVYYKK